jgi:preprotein translocase subunit YajC
MSLLIRDAWAQSAGGDPSGGLLGLLPIVLIFVLFYFLLIRPQQKRQKQQKVMVEGLKKGDEVVTAGGTLGKITDVGENFIDLEIANGVEIKVQRHSVQSMMPKGTIKEA